MLQLTRSLILVYLIFFGLACLQGCSTYTKTGALWEGARNSQFQFLNIEDVYLNGEVLVGLVSYTSSSPVNPLHDVKYLVVRQDEPDLVMKADSLRKLLVDNPGQLPGSRSAFNLGKIVMIDHPALPGKADEFRFIEAWNGKTPTASQIFFPTQIPKSKAYRARETVIAATATVPFLVTDVLMYPVYIYRIYRSFAAG